MKGLSLNIDTVNRVLDTFPQLIYDGSVPLHSYEEKMDFFKGSNYIVKM